MFPRVSSKNLEGRMFQLPQDFESEYNIILFAFDMYQQRLVDTWIPFAQSVEAQNANVRYYELPTVEDYGLFYRMRLDFLMRTGIQDRRARERTITLYVDREPFVQGLNMNPREIYTLLVDRAGNILWRGAGAFTEDKGRELLGALPQTV